MPESIDEVIGHYESIQEEDRLRSGMGEIELVRTQEVLRRHLSLGRA